MLHQKKGNERGRGNNALSSISNPLMIIKKPSCERHFSYAPWSLYTMSISVLKMIDNNQGSRRSESQADMYLLVFVPGGVEAFMLSRQATLDEALIDRTCN
jgi:hypothetical protein